MGDVRIKADEAAVVLYARKLAAREEHSYCKGRNELKSEVVRFKKRSQTPLFTHYIQSLASGLLAQKGSQSFKSLHMAISSIMIDSSNILCCFVGTNWHLSKMLPWMFPAKILQR